MLKDGSNRASLEWKFGIKRKGSMFEVKKRFSVDIANFINVRLTMPNMFITPVNNKNIQFIYGHCTELELDMFERCVKRAYAVRHSKIAEQYLAAALA